MAGVVCAAGIIASFVASISLFASASDKYSVNNYVSGGKTSSMIVAGFFVFVLGIIFALLSYF